MVEQTEVNICCGFDYARNEQSNLEEVEMDDGSIGYESLSANCGSSDLSVIVSLKRMEETSKTVYNTF
jgi:hypothetical protein